MHPRQSSLPLLLLLPRLITLPQLLLRNLNWQQRWNRQPLLQVLNLALCGQQLLPQLVVGVAQLLVAVAELLLLRISHTLTAHNSICVDSYI